MSGYEVADMAFEWLARYTPEIPPCPPWCDGPPGHHALSLVEQGMRGHEHLLGEVVCSATRARPCTVGVYLSQLEVVQPGGLVVLNRPGIFLSGVVDIADDLTAEEARLLAGALVSAVDSLAQVTGRI